MAGNNAKRAAAWVGICLASATVTRADSLFDYNVVVTDTLTASSHIQGRTFVNNLVTNNQPDFAQSAAAGTGDTLDVAGQVTGNGLTMERGVFRHAHPIASPFQLNLNGGSSGVTDASTSITSLSNQMNAIASQYGTFLATSLAPAGTNVSITATGNAASVFSIAASDLSKQNESIQVNTGSASAVIIKVLGNAFTFGPSEHESINGSSQNVIWYFPDATTITLNDSVWSGSILAPLAILTSPNQNIEGGVYVRSFQQTAEVHLPGNTLTPVFSGPVPLPVPSVAMASFLLMGCGLTVYSARSLRPLR